MHEELLRRLRCTSDEEITCESCKYRRYDKHYRDYFCDVHELQRDAATCIQSLTAETTAQKQEIERLTAERDAAIERLCEYCRALSDRTDTTPTCENSMTWKKCRFDTNSQKES